MKLITKIFVIISVINLAGLIYLYLLSGKQNENVVFINTSEVFDQFTLKKELEMKLTQTKNARQAVLDSLELQFKILLEQAEIKNKKIIVSKEDIELKRKEYLLKKQKFEEDNEMLARQYDEQIWNQLNQYIQDYGKEKELDIIMGTTGQGNLMYADNVLNITNTIVEYVNRRFTGN